MQIEKKTKDQAMATPIFRGQEEEDEFSKESAKGKSRDCDVLQGRWTKSSVAYRSF